MAKKTKFFRIATEGDTTDGRVIDRQWLSQMAENYNPATYGARVFLEHLRGVLPDGPFRAYGDVLALKTEEVDGKLVLMAQLDPTDDLVAMVKARQKVFTSMEVDPNFAKTGSAYLVGLAVTDSPASLGTEMLQFSATSGVLASRKQRPENLFSAACEAALELESDESAGLLARVKAMFTGKQQADTAAFTEVHSAIDLIANEVQSATAAREALAGTVATLDGNYSAIKQQVDQLAATVSALKKADDTTPATHHHRSRAPAAGATETETDC